MALRVLLADESSTIKKVMQLALQDFGVEVRSVPVGIDVLQVAQSYQPEIIFADVLLAKKNGYEVCKELKSDSQLKKTPIVLMWSGFMEFDEAKAKEAKADRRIEKPFDAETLRAIVKELVPSVRGNVIANYLSFPNLPPIVESAPKNELEEIEEFQQVPLPKAKPANPRSSIAQPMPPAPEESEHERWSEQNIRQFKLNVPLDSDPDLITAPMEDYGNLESAFALTTSGQEISIADVGTNPSKVMKKVADPAPVYTSQKFDLSEQKVEEYLRQEVRATIEKIAWKILPDIAERIVREELNKLLKDNQ